MRCRVSGLVIITVFFALLAGCSSQTNVKKGDRLAVQSDIRESAETQWEDTYTDGFKSVIPTGTILEVLVTPRPGAKVIEVVPIEVNGSKDPETVTAFFVPEHIRNREGFKGFSFAIKSEYLGSEVKRVD